MKIVRALAVFGLTWGLVGLLAGCASPSAPPALSDAQIRTAREIFCAAHSGFAAEAARLAPCSYDENGESSGDCSQRVALTGKYYGELPDRVASALGISREQAQAAIGRAQLGIRQHRLPACQ